MTFTASLCRDLRLLVLATLLTLLAFAGLFASYTFSFWCFRMGLVDFNGGGILFIATEVIYLIGLFYIQSRNLERIRGWFGITH